MGKESLIQSPEPPSAQQTNKICRDVCNVCGVPETEGVRSVGSGQWGQVSGCAVWSAGPWAEARGGASVLLFTESDTLPSACSHFSPCHRERS